jgi:hypothetical protein
MAAAAVMFALSYFWHGYVLTDLDQISYPTPFFLALAGILYAVIALAMAFTFDALKFDDKIIIKGISFGVAIGFFLYLIAFVLGVSFKADGIEHIVIDFIWQMVETGSGGLIVGMVHFHYERKAQLLGHE